MHSMFHHLFINLELFLDNRDILHRGNFRRIFDHELVRGQKNLYYSKNGQK